MSGPGREKVLAYLNATGENTLVAALDIRFVDFGEDFVVATMPVEARHRQPYGILHGGATAALAETAGSIGSAMKLHGTDRSAVGLELSINHLRPVREGEITARAEAIHLGRSTHLWQIDIREENQKRVAFAKLTMMVRDAT